MTDNVTVAKVGEDDGQLYLAVLDDFYEVLGLKAGDTLVFKRTDKNTFELTRIEQ